MYLFRVGAPLSKKAVCIELRTLGWVQHIPRPPKSRAVDPSALWLLDKDVAQEVWQAVSLDTDQRVSNLNMQRELQWHIPFCDSLGTWLVSIGLVIPERNPAALSAGSCMNSDVSGCDFM